MNDIRYALRSLSKQPGFTAVAVLTLALGIGANSAIFSVVDSVLLQPLPYQGADRIVYVWETREGGGFASASAADFTDWRAQSQSFEALAAQQSATFTFTGSGEPERLHGARVSADYFNVLGLRLVHGRSFLADEDRYGGPRVAVLGHGFWTRRFGADPSIVGGTVALNGEPYTVIGILQPHVRVTTDALVPLALSPAQLAATGTRAYPVVGRLRPGVSLVQAQAEMQGIAARLASVRPWSNTGRSISLVPIREQILGNGARTVLILFGAVGFVLLIACANVANLLLARAVTRRREIGVRAALGAGWARIARQLLAESLVLAALGGLAGLLAAYWSLSLLVGILPADVPRLAEVAMRPGVLWITGSAAALVGVVFGLVPAALVSRGDLHDALREGSRGATAHRGAVRGVLVVAEVGLAVLLLAGAGLLIRSFGELLSVRPGVDLDRVLALQLALPSRYATPEQVTGLYRDVLQRAAGVPGVQGVATSANVPLSGGGYTISFTVAGRPVPAPQETPLTLSQVVSPDYFRILGISVLQGRAFEPTDRQGSHRVAVINQTMARRFWPSENPLGQRVTLDDGADEPAEIVGVVADVRHYGPAAPVEPELYLSTLQLPAIYWRWTAGSLNLLVRAGDPSDLAPAVREAVWSVDRDIPLFNIRTLAEVQRATLAPTRSLMLLLSLLAGAALMLSAVGIYGVMAFSVGQRTRELGIRITLGARQQDVVRMVLRQGIVLTALGVVLGLGGAAAVTRVLRSSLFGVGPTDPLTLAGSTLLLIGVAALACYVPARHAARVDPMDSLRHE